jgi:DNA polymerase-3 subunit epsilon
MGFFSFFRDKRPQGELPGFLEDYLQLEFSNTLKSAIDQQSFTVLDCETTGLQKSDSIITIGAVKVVDTEIALSRVLDQQYPVDRIEQAEVHGELGELDHDRSLEDLLQELLSFIGTDPIVGHHISFDVGKINQLLQHRFPGVKLKNKVIDTFGLIKRIDPVSMERNVAGHDSFQLDNLCKKYGIPVENRHTALGDAFMTAQLFIKLSHQVRKRGVKWVKEL